MTNKRAGVISFIMTVTTAALFFIVTGNPFSDGYKFGWAEAAFLICVICAEIVGLFLALSASTKESRKNRQLTRKYK